jgi:hypothetical protein
MNGKLHRNFRVRHRIAFFVVIERKFIGLKEAAVSIIIQAHYESQHGRCSLATDVFGSN